MVATAVTAGGKERAERSVEMVRETPVLPVFAVFAESAAEKEPNTLELEVAVEAPEELVAAMAAP